MTTKHEIVELLKRNPNAIARALVVLSARQTSDELATQQTRHLNGKGFTPADAKMGVSMANYYSKYNKLTAKQLAYWQTPNKSGTWRICKYAGQLLEEAQAKAAAAVVAALRSQQVEDDAVIEEFEAHVRHKNDFAALESAAEERAYKHAMQLEMALEAQHG